MTTGDTLILVGSLALLSIGFTGLIVVFAAIKMAGDKTLPASEMPERELKQSDGQSESWPSNANHLASGARREIDNTKPEPQPDLGKLLALHKTLK